jgi:glucokinase
MADDDGRGEVTIALDLGGTHVRSAVVSDDGRVLHRQRQRTPRTDPTIDFLVRLIKAELVEVPENHGVTGVVIGLPGIIDHLRESLVAAPNIPQRWIENLSEEWLSAKTGLPISLANDADLAAVGEANFGAGRDHRDVVYVTISTGVGAGIVVDGKLVRGRLSGGEIGHTIIDWSDADAGIPATVEELGSGTAIELMASAAGITERGADLADLVHLGHPGAVGVWNRAIRAVGIGIVNLAWLVAPEVVIVGGGVGRNIDLVAPVLKRELERHGPPAAGPVEVTVAELGDDAALAGAAAWWVAIGRDDQ